MIASQPLTGARVADREREEAKAEGKHQNVEHDGSPDGTDRGQVEVAP
jgi:hypothetical protein